MQLSERLGGCLAVDWIHPATTSVKVTGKGKRKTKPKSLECKALSYISIIIKVEYFSKVLIADGVHFHPGGRVVEVRQLVC